MKIAIWQERREQSLIPDIELNKWYKNIIWYNVCCYRKVKRLMYYVYIFNGLYLLNRKLKTMELTGKCKEAFEEWLINNKINQEVLEVDSSDYYASYDVYDLFYNIPQSMQYGVYVDFFDSVGIELIIWKEGIYFDVELFCGMKNEWIQSCGTRQEARTEAVKKANELLNNKLK